MIIWGLIPTFAEATEEKLAGGSLFASPNLNRVNTTTVNIVIRNGKRACLKTWAVLLLFSLELKISGVAVQSIHENSEKW